MSPTYTIFAKFFDLTESKQSSFIIDKYEFQVLKMEILLG